jgi:alpha-glucuronidase
MTFPAHADDAPGANEDVQTVVADILAKSRRVYEGYTSPLGIAMIVFGGDGGGENARTGSCAPITAGPGPGPDGAECPVSPGRRLAEEALGDLRGGLDHYWVDPCSNYGFSNYSTFGLGCDRTTTGTGYADAYAPAVRDLYTDPATCPQDLLLWFHNLAWTHPMPKPPGYPVTPGASVTLFEHIRFTHDAAVRDAAALASSWDTLEGKIDDARFYGVQARFAQQVNDAGVMRDTILDQYADWAGF